LRSVAPSLFAYPSPFRSGCLVIALSLPVPADVLVLDLRVVVLPFFRKEPGPEIPLEETGPDQPGQDDDAGKKPLAENGDGLIARSEEHTSELQSRENLVC